MSHLVDMVIKEFAEHTVNLEYSDLSDETVLNAKKILLDSLGVGIKGASTEHGRIATQFSENASGDTNTLFNGSKSSLQNAVLSNGICIHSIDYDDSHEFYHPEASTHIASSVVSAALGAAEEEKATGKELLTGIVCGYDIAAKVAREINPTVRGKGYHPTAITNGLGAAAAIASIRDMPCSACVNAIAIAVDQASGTAEYHNTGSMMKHFHGGRPARDGVVAATLATLGYEGDKTAISGEKGLAEVLADGDAVDASTSDLGEVFEVNKTSIKPYPACRQAHTAIDTALDIHSRCDGDIESHAIESIELQMVDYVANRLDKPSPGSDVQAMLSVQYSVVAALLTGEITLSQYEEEYYKDPEVMELMGQVNVVSDDSFTQHYPEERPTQLTVRYEDGNEVSSRVNYPSGSPHKPLSIKYVEEKFARLAANERDEDAIVGAIECVLNIEEYMGAEMVRNVFGVE